MIDFISTHPSAHPQTVACARLLAAVIAQAVEDASSKQVAMADNAAAVSWLFDRSSLFSKYAALIGADAEVIRNALLTPASGNEPINSRFDESRRRYLRASYVKWLARRQAEQRVLMEKGVKHD